MEGIIMAEYHLWDVLDELRSPNYAWVDLTHSLDNNSPVWSGIPAGSVELAKTVYDWGNEMLDCLIQTFKFPGQFGTHIDFPGHFVRDAALSEKYGVHSMIYPLCVIDITAKAKQDIHYAVTIQDILDYENKYGTIPSGGFCGAAHRLGAPLARYGQPVRHRRKRCGQLPRLVGGRSALFV